MSALVGEHHREAAINVPPRSTALPSETAETAAKKRDCHLQFITEQGRVTLQTASGYTTRTRAKTAIGRFKQVTGDRLRLRTDQRRATEVNVAIHLPNCMLDLRRPNSVRVA